jgi:hypothetical protein
VRDLALSFSRLTAPDNLRGVHGPPLSLWPALLGPALLVGCFASSPEPTSGSPTPLDIDQGGARPSGRGPARAGSGDLWARCYDGFQSTGDAPADLARLTAACGSPAGLTALTTVRSGAPQAEDAPAERFLFRAHGGRCYRFFSVGGAGVADLDMAVVAPDGRLAAADASRDRSPVVPPRGPLCASRDGVYAVEVAVQKGSGAFVLQVWGD